MKEELYRNKDYLIENYIKKRLDMEVIGKLNNVSGNTVGRWLNKFGIKKRPFQGYGDLNYWNKEWLYKEYIKKQRSACDIAREFKCGDDVIIRRLKAFQIPVRGSRSWWTLKSKEKQSKSQSGSKNPMWRGGVSDKITEIRRSPKMKKWCRTIFERDNFQCKICGNNKDLNAHHIYPIGYFPDLILEINNGITLCKECHYKTYNIEWYFIPLFVKMVQEYKKGDKDE